MACIITTQYSPWLRPGPTTTKADACLSNLTAASTAPENRALKAADWEHIHSEFAGSKLASRGWVTQELCLSKRVVWFSVTDAYWIDSVSGPVSLSSFKTFSVSHLENIGPGSMPQNTDPDTRATSWYRLIAKYSRMELSYPEDYLPALSGLCYSFYPAHNNEYLAGIWKDSLVKGLSWYRDTRDPIQPRPKMPSWSFGILQSRQIVHLNFLILFRERDPEDLDFVVKSTDIRLASKDPYGPISFASLTLEIWKLKGFFLEFARSSSHVHRTRKHRHEY